MKPAVLRASFLFLVPMALLWLSYYGAEKLNCDYSPLSHNPVPWYNTPYFVTCFVFVVAPLVFAIVAVVSAAESES